MVVDPYLQGLHPFLWWGISPICASPNYGKCFAIYARHTVSGSCTPPFLSSRYNAVPDSDIVHLQVLGRHICVLGSPKPISELLDKRSSVTSDRQHSPVVRL